MKYRAVFEVRGFVEVEIEASDWEDAEQKASKLEETSMSFDNVELHHELFEMWDETGDVISY